MSVGQFTKNGIADSGIESRQGSQASSNRDKLNASHVKNRRGTNFIVKSGVNDQNSLFPEIVQGQQRPELTSIAAHNSNH